MATIKAIEARSVWYTLDLSAYLDYLHTLLSSNLSFLCRFIKFSQARLLLISALS